MEPPNLFSLYHDFTKASEPPPNFHAWSCVALISALLGKKCYIPQGHFTVFPNLYVVLVGDAGSRKTTAMDIAGGLLRLTDVPMAPDSATRESLIDDLAKNIVNPKIGDKTLPYSQSAAFVSELNEFLGGQHINSSMVRFLTAIWDRVIFKERTRKGGEIVIKNPYFTLIGCCTPNWMAENLRENLISDGFARRTIFVLENEVANSVAWPTIPDTDLLPVLKREVERIRHMTGEFRLSKPAYDLYVSTYPSFREEAKKFHDKIASYFSSKHILILKVSMCLSAAMRQDRVVDTSILNLAMQFLAETEKKLDIVFANIGRNEKMQNLTELIKFLENNNGRDKKGVPIDMIWNALYSNADQNTVREILDVGVSTGLLESVSGVASNAPLNYRLAKASKRLLTTNLIELASRTTPLLTESAASSSSSEQARRLDPITEQQLIQRELREAALSKGILLMGKKTESRSEDPVP